MRLTAKAFLMIVVLALSTAPLLAFPVARSLEPSVTAPDSSRSPAGDVAATLGLALAVGMAIRIRDTGSIAKKFVSNAGRAGGDYADGVRQAGGDWEANTRAAGDNYAAGVQQAIGDKRFEKGVSEAGAGKYVEKATTLGSQRYPTGVAASEGAYAKGVQPHLDAMKSVSLPARRPKGDPANMQRAAVIAQLNRAIKTGK